MNIIYKSKQLNKKHPHVDGHAYAFYKCVKEIMLVLDEGTDIVVPLLKMHDGNTVDYFNLSKGLQYSSLLHDCIRATRTAIEITEKNKSYTEYDIFISKALWNLDESLNYIFQQKEDFYGNPVRPYSDSKTRYIEAMNKIIHKSDK